MNDFQMAKQIKHILKKREWPGGSNVVFPAVVISSGFDEMALQRFRLPLAVIRPMGSTADPNKNQNANVIRQSYGIRVFAGVSGDGVGETALMGSHRTGGKDESLGRGLLEVQEQLIESVGSITGINGARIINRLKSMVDTTLKSDRKHIAFRDYLFDAMVGNARFYHPATRLSATDLGGGSVSLTWRLPPDRFDFVRMRLRRAVGATPPATPTSGTDVTLADPINDTSVTDSPGAGTFSYSLFGMYDDLAETPVDETVENSAAETVASVVVT